jgi:hypothetical protein
MFTKAFDQVLQRNEELIDLDFCWAIQFVLELVMHAL